MLEGKPGRAQLLSGSQKQDKGTMVAQAMPRR